MALGCQGGRVDQHAVALHAVQRLAAGDLQFIDIAQACIGLQQRPQALVYRQRHIGVFACVLRGAVNVHLVKANLRSTFAAQVFKAQAFTPQVPRSQALQAVGLVYLEHVALQHGVVQIALHFNAMVGKDMAVVFDMLAQFGARRVLQPGLQARQHVLQRQLLRRSGKTMGQRDVRRLARCDAQADAHDLRLHLVQRGGLGIHRHQCRRVDLGHPHIERLPVQHRLVGIIGVRFQLLDGLRGRVAKQAGLRGPGRGSGGSGRLLHRLGQALETVTGVEIQQTGLVRGQPGQIVQPGQLRQVAR